MKACFDAFAWLAWLAGEAPAMKVRELLERAAKKPGAIVYTSAINLGEVYYRLVRLRGAAAAGRFWEGARAGRIPTTIVAPTLARVRAAAALKGQLPVSYADAFAMVTAIEHNAPLATGDPEIRAVAKAAGVKLIWLGGR